MTVSKIPRVIELAKILEDDIREQGLAPGQRVQVGVRSDTDGEKTFEAIARIDTPNEVLYYQHGGILHYVLRSLL